MAQTKKTKAKQATKSNTTARQSKAKGDTAVGEREGRVVAADASYALAGLANDALQLANEAMRLASALPGKARERADDLRDLRARRDAIEGRVADLRERAEERFDAKATEGRTVVEDLLGEERVRRVFDQAKNARSQVKAAVTSLRKTADETVSAGAEAGKRQASTAKSQTKGAVTSVRKTAEAAADAARGGE